MKAKLIIGVIFMVAVLMALGGAIGRKLFPIKEVVTETKTETEYVYIMVENNTDDSEVTAEKVENYIDEAKEKAIEMTDYYTLTEQEYTEVCEVVMAESGAECYEGQMAVAQCILNACLKDGIRPTEVYTRYKYSKTRKTPTDSVKSAVNAVFKDGEKVTEEEILYFYAPKYAKGTFHETQRFVIEIGGHRFFAQK